MKPKRIDFSNDPYPGKGGYCLCHICGSELYGPKGTLSKLHKCPVCNCVLRKDNSHFLLIPNMPSNGFDVNSLFFNESNLELSVHPESDFPSRAVMNQQGFYPPSHGNIYGPTVVDNAFNYLHLASAKSASEAIVQKIKDLEQMDMDSVDSVRFAVDIHKIDLKKYLEHLINIEIDIQSVKLRLQELFFQSEDNLKKIELKEGQTIAKYTKALEDAEDFLSTYKEKAELKKIVEPKSSGVNVDYNAPLEPIEPIEPIKPQEPKLQTPGLFNRKKVEESNAELRRKYKAELEKYEIKLENTK